MPAPTNTQKKTRRRFPRKVGNKTLDQILARREELLKELDEIDGELSKANLALNKAPKFSQQLVASNSSSQPRVQQNWSPPIPNEYSQDTGSTMVSPMGPEEQVAQLHNNIHSQVEQLRHRQGTPQPYIPQPAPEGSPF